MTTFERVDAGTHANTVYRLAIEILDGKSDGWKEHFWMTLSGLMIPHFPTLRKVDPPGVVPMTDREADDFAESAVPFGRYREGTVFSMVEHDPDYCRWLADDAPNFADDLKRYLAREKREDD